MHNLVHFGTETDIFYFFTLKIENFTADFAEHFPGNFFKSIANFSDAHWNSLQFDSKMGKLVKYFFRFIIFLFSPDPLDGPCYRPIFKLSAAAVSLLSRASVRLFKCLRNGES